MWVRSLLFQHSIKNEKGREITVSFICLEIVRQMMKWKKCYFFAATKRASYIAGIFCGVDQFGLKQMLRVEDHWGKAEWSQYCSKMNGSLDSL